MSRMAIEHVSAGRERDLGEVTKEKKRKKDKKDKKEKKDKTDKDKTDKKDDRVRCLWCVMCRLHMHMRSGMHASILWHSPGVLGPGCMPALSHHIVTLFI